MFWELALWRTELGTLSASDKGPRASHQAQSHDSHRSDRSVCFHPVALTGGLYASNTYTDALQRPILILSNLNDLIITLMFSMSPKTTTSISPIP